MNWSQVALVAILAYNAYHSYLFRTALNFADSDPDLPQLDALMGLGSKALKAVGLLSDVSWATRDDLEAIDSFRQEFVKLQDDSLPLQPQPVLDCKSGKTCKRGEISFKTTDDGRTINMLTVEPLKTDGTGKPVQVVIYFHPGGGVIGTAESPTIFAIPAFTDSSVFSVDYRLAPEYPYPAGVDDCYEATKWIAENATKYSKQKLRIVLAGDSAGSMMAAAVAQRWKDEGKSPKIHKLILVIPMLGPVLSRSYSKFENIHLLSMAQMSFFWDMYSTNLYDCVIDPICSPVSASVERLRGIANKAIIIPGRADVLFDEAQEYARKLNLAGVETKFMPLRGTHIGVYLFSKELRSGSALQD